jgi:PTH1 family peptidyl-tRNA hydrolase
MSFLIVGLGNIGEKYEGTRHNIGFDVVDHLARKKNAVFQSERLGQVARFQLGGHTVYLLKPGTFMNLSGDAVKLWLEKTGAELSELMVITDDLALPFGSIRIRGKGSAGGHNGLTDIEQKLKSQDYARMRMGIGADFPKGRQAEFVLDKFPGELQTQKEAWISRAADAVLCFCSRGLPVAMNQFNGPLPGLQA